MRSSTGFLAVVVTTAACGTGVDSAPQRLGDPQEIGSPGDNGFCQQAAGPRHDWSTLDELKQLMVGRWVQCSEHTFTAWQRGLGIEITPDGNYFLLVDDGHGGLVRGGGFLNEGTWDATEVAGAPPFVNLWSTPTSLFGGTPVFGDNPREFAFELGLAYTELALYQQLPP